MHQDTRGRHGPATPGQAGAGDGLDRRDRARCGGRGCTGRGPPSSSTGGRRSGSRRPSRRSGARAATARSRASPPTCPPPRAWTIWCDNCPRWTSWSTTWASSSPSPSRRSPTPTGCGSSRSNVMSGVRLTRHYLPGMKAPQLGPHRVRLQRVGGADPRRDDPLRHDQDGPACRRPRAWPRRSPGRASRSTACCPARPNRRAWRRSWPTWRGSGAWTARSSRPSSSRRPARVR